MRPGRSRVVSTHAHAVRPSAIRTPSAARSILWRRSAAEFALIERLVLYVTITTVVFYWCNERGASGALLSVENVYFLVLGASIIMAYRFGRNRSFEVTPTDFLIILIALLVPTLTRTLFPHQFISEVAIKTLVLFYATELILAESRNRVWPVRVAACAVLSVLALRLALDRLPVQG